VWAVEFARLRLLTWAYALEDSMRAKRLITRAILAAVAAGTIAGGVAVPIATAVAPATGAGTVVAGAKMIGYGS
jgi:hypothetical protein